MMTESEINRHGYRIEIARDIDFMPFRMPNTIEYATAYLIHPNGRREYIDSTSGAWSADTSWIKEKAIRRAQELIGKGGAI